MAGKKKKDHIIPHEPVEKAVNAFREMASQLNALSISGDLAKIHALGICAAQEAADLEVVLPPDEEEEAPPA